MPRVTYPQRILDPNVTYAKDGGVLAVICDWVEQNAGRIQSAHDLAAGWEVWAQVELALHINLHVGKACATRATGGTYQANLFADVIVKNDEGKPVHVIELKCRNPGTSPADFRAELNDDRFKLTENAMHLSFQHARKWAVGINLGDEITDLGGDWHTEVEDVVYHRSFV